jgi:hypothetical protein
MSEIHCHACGGFIIDPAGVSYQLPSAAAHTVAPRSGLCTCHQSVVYGPPPGYVSLPGVSPSIDLRAMAARN